MLPELPAAVEVYLIGRERLQAAVWPGGVVEIDVATNLRSDLLYRLVGVQVDLLLLDRLPDALYEYVVAPTAPAIHAYPDPFFL
jgi:hypothetical protein